jgi:uncharacterized repeat protein (TIGR03847 family)
MPRQVIDLNPAEYITVGTVEENGERVFLLQGQSSSRPVTLIIDHEQALALSIAGGELLNLVEEQYSREINQFQVPPEEVMLLRTPVQPLFEVAQFQLGYDAQHDYIVIISAELPIDPATEELSDVNVVRFWITREQMVGLIQQIRRVVAEDNPPCPACGQPAPPEGHVCVRMN